MRLQVVALSIIVTLLASAAAVNGSGLPWAADFPPYQSTGTAQQAGPDQTSQNSGFSSVDFLGRIRQQFDIGRLISMFPFTLPGIATAETAPDRVEFLGFTYKLVNASTLSGDFYYTGEQYSGRRIYVSASGKKSGNVPDQIFLKEGNSYVTYAISDRPAVYAYVLCGAFNTNETVRFGVANDGQAKVELPNAAPYEIRRKENGAWRTIYSAIAAQVITRLPGGKHLEWQWDQRLDDGSLVPFGDYEVVIGGKYTTPFRISGDMPVVEQSDTSYDPSEVEVLAASSPALEAFRNAYPAPSASVKEDIVSIMQYKAWALGLDPEQLRNAIEAAGDGLPCMAVRASYRGQPAWIILFSPGPGTPTSAVYVINEATVIKG
jgi:hypothetical protein